MPKKAKPAKTSRRNPPSKPKPVSTYDACKAAWELRDKTAKGGSWLVDKPELELDAVPFLSTLRRLGYHLQDQRYLDIHRELVTGDLVDHATGKWSRFGTTLANLDTRFMCELIEETIAAGFTEREAIAQAVVELELRAASFRAACTRVKRLLDEYRKTVKQKP